ncbi:LamG domain-containing protein, partial [Lysinibacillus sp. NPDC093692]|uniref:LamG domain-containing protein n=1 Tax=Lysinibacillus sp. NPDC093692 TaxID=3390578 RepID=UPI003D06A2A1
MANSKDNLNKYAKTFIGFDEPNGNAMDTIGGYTGTVVNSPTRVTGWNGKGNAMSFNGTNQYVEFNNKIIPIGIKSVRFKIKSNNSSLSNFEYILSNTTEVGSGLRFVLQTNGSILVSLHQDSIQTFQIATAKKILDGKWHDVFFTWDGSINNDAIKIYVDDMTVPDITTTAKSIESNTPTNNLIIARHTVSSAHYFNGQIDQIEIYDRVISPIPDKYLVQHNSDYKYHDGADWQSTTPTEENFIQYGMNNLDQIKENQWKELSGYKSVIMWSDFVDKQFTSVVLNKNEFKAQDLLGDKPQAIYYTDSDTSLITVETGVDPYSVYDYIGELPTIVAYTESTDDIIVSTTTEPFDIYEEFGDSVEVLYYTDDEAVNEADLILEANWSPIDELEGDFEVVTWTDEALETAQRVLEMKAIPQPQFIKLLNPKRVYGSLDDVFVNDISQSYRDEARYFVAGHTPDKWYVWDKESS